ncbi:MAG TPA: diguanylate cyclase, partial [Rectinemataceae bacterium]|nr:diguanylate cyclase [Rectinemataceae bacterium]
RYGSKETRDFLERETTQIAALVRDDIVELGYMSRGRWEQIAGIYASLGMLPAATVPAGFLWSPAPASPWSWRLLGFVALWIIVASTIAVVYWRLYGRLRRTLGRVRMFETVIEQSLVSVIITDPETTIEFVNPGFTAVTGYTAEEVVGQKTKILKSGQTSRETIVDLWTHLAKGETWVGEFVNRRKDGKLFAEEAHIAPVTDDRGKVTHYVAVKLDITERKAAEAQIAHLAHNDVLTDLPNRALFADRFKQALIAAARDRLSLAVFCMDLDGFKPINDTYGHAAGDEVLCEASRRWSAAVRKVDTVARMGGDEFAVLAPGVRTKDEALLIAGKLAVVLDEPIATQAAMVRVGTSVGWAIYPDDGGELEALLRRADEALYADKAKRKGGR